MTTRVLVDSNAYFRLAQSIRPLLNVVFGAKNYRLHVLKELQEEYDKNPRLLGSFAWVNDPEYRENRSNHLLVTQEEKLEIQRAYQFILDYARHVYPGVSKVDVKCLAHAEQLNITVVTDDVEMRELAKEYGIAAINTLELLKLMLDSGHLKPEKVREIASYWVYLNDTPKDFRKDYKRIFGEDSPR